MISSVQGTTLPCMGLLRVGLGKGNLQSRWGGWCTAVCVSSRGSLSSQERTTDAESGSILERAGVPSCRGEHEQEAGKGIHSRPCLCPSMVMHNHASCREDERSGICPCSRVCKGPSGLPFTFFLGGTTLFPNLKAQIFKDVLAQQ